MITHRTNKKKILLVEDNVSLSEVFTLLFRKAGYEVEVAYDGKDALERLDTYVPNIILLDLLMPIMNGREFLRAYDNPHALPIIIFSNLDAKSDVEDVLQLGATRYILKAWASPSELVRVVEDTIAGESTRQVRRR